MSALTALSALTLADKIQRREVSAVEVVEAHIARIVESNPSTNAVVRYNFDGARREAEVADALIETRTPVGPFHGVPFTVKDCLDVEGMGSSCGLVSRRTHRATADAVVVARMREAGAIVLGKTNLPDNCWAQETDSLLFGRTNNPLDVTRTVGGSSGGEAAVIAAHGSPMGIGTDIAGSIRLPAHFTGIVGFRPTSGTLSEIGNWPAPEGRLSELEAIGPMARNVGDVAAAFDVMRGAAPELLETTSLRGRRVAFWSDDGVITSDAGVHQAVTTAVNALVSFGMVPVASAPSARRLAGLGWTAMIADDERASIARGFGNGELWNPLRECLRGESRVSSGALLYWCSSHYGSRLLRALGVDGLKWRKRLLTQLTELLGEGGVAVCPIFPTPAPTHGWSMRTLGPVSTLSYQVWVNLAGSPGLTVPIRRSRGELPIGVQIVGLPGADRDVLAAGQAIEQALAQGERT